MMKAELCEVKKKKEDLAASNIEIVEEIENLQRELKEKASKISVTESHLNNLKVEGDRLKKRLAGLKWY